MHITNYHVHNVLRAYGKQLTLGRRSVRTKNVAGQNTSDNITISAEARRKAVIEKVSADIVERIVRSGPSDVLEEEAFKELESEFGNNLVPGEDSSTELVFKVVDQEKGEEIRRLSIEDSEVVKNRLKEITRRRVDANMF